MASVQELLLAAQAKKSPFLTLAEGAVQGLNKAQDNSLERTKTLLYLDQQRQQMQQQAEMNQQIQSQIAAQQETGIKRAFGAVGGTDPVLPQQKFTQKIKQDEKGAYSREFSVVDTTPKTDTQSFQAKEYVDANGQTRIGSFDTKSATFKQSPNDPVAPAAGATDKSMSRAITKAKVELATTRPMVNSVMSEIDRVVQLNEDSFGGTLGAARMKASRATGIGDESEKFKRTADVVNTMQSQVAKVLKSTFGGQLSDGEREYLNGVYGALPGLSVSERAIAMKNVKAMLQAKLEGNQSTLDELLTDAGLEPDGNRKTGSAVAAPSSIKTINSQAEYDALPSGTDYIDSEGNKARKN